MHHDYHAMTLRPLQQSEISRTRSTLSALTTHSALTCTVLGIDHTHALIGASPRHYIVHCTFFR